ncbi:MotA/TolQ/ExbB proton channel family protein [Saccharicrinis sp. FJH2]|uniref:MotA/TolQ/ExbB proton channel family protein n=1 Tax=Saccharicrinis sp. FJH65 TaxID=3344659 RepID=UPI0035F404EB
MKKLFYEGGAFFMGILTLVLIIIIAWAIYHFIIGTKSKESKTDLITHRLSYIKSFGFFAMITGILGQLIGMYVAFSYIAKVGDISKSLFFGGLKVSMIAPIYGIIIFLFSLLLWFVMDYILHRNKVS